MRIADPGKTVIVVSGNRPESALEKQMESRGIDLRWAPTIKAASVLLSSVRYTTVVITELALKDGNWRDLLETVRRIDTPIPVLLLSPTSTAELWWDALDCGIEDILRAPLSTDLLCEYLEKRFRHRSDRM